MPYNARVPLTLQLAPGVPDSAALGAEDARDLLRGDGMEGAPHAELMAQEGAVALFRLPLPGTPVGSEGLRGRPRGAGTGWIYLRRYERAGLLESLRARLGAPRSLSLAALEWNLLCHLRAAGVATPEPLAVASEGGSFFAQRSALVTRALEGTLPLLEWIDREPDPRRQGLALRAVGLCLGRLIHSRLYLPRLRVNHIHVSTARSQSRPDRSPPEQDGGCAAEQIVQASSDATQAEFSRGMAWRRLPDVVITSVRGGRLLPEPEGRRAARMLTCLSEAADSLSVPSQLKVVSLALRSLEQEERAEALEQLNLGS